MTIALLLYLMCPFGCSSLYSFLTYQTLWSLFYIHVSSKHWTLILEPCNRSVTHWYPMGYSHKRLVMGKKYTYYMIEIHRLNKQNVGGQQLRTTMYLLVFQKKAEIKIIFSISPYKSLMLKSRISRNVVLLERQHQWCAAMSQLISRSCMKMEVMKQKQPQENSTLWIIHHWMSSRTFGRRFVW